MAFCMLLQNDLNPNLDGPIFLNFAFFYLFTRTGMTELVCSNERKSQDRTEPLNSFDQPTENCFPWKYCGGFEPLDDGSTSLM